jgi:dipeptidyl aminopeptidase/acylaminoacyl peptidase
MRNLLLQCIAFLFLGAAIPAWCFELESILNAPNTSGLVSSGKSGRIAWVSYEAGVRNIWTASAPAFKPVRLTRFESDDGQVISGLAFTADGSLLYYEHGNQNGENPASAPIAPEQTIHVIDLESGDSQVVAPGHGVRVSPDGNRIVYLKDNKPVLVTVAETRSGASGEADAGPAHLVLFHPRGTINHLTWSPDSKRIAFSEDRAGHSFIGVYDITGGSLSWIAPSVDLDSHPAWSPDGTQIAFFRTPGLKKDETRSVVESRRVALWVADTAGRSASPIWEPDTENGFFAQDYAAEPLRWSADNRIVFYSEHEQWVHIYSIEADGTGILDLTPGPCEAEQSALSSDGKVLYFSSNCDAGTAADIDRRHLWSVPVRGGYPKSLTSGRSLETDPFPVGDGGMLAFRDAGISHPAAISVLETKGADRRKVFPAELPVDFPEREMVEPAAVDFTAEDGTMVHGQLFMPRKPPDKSKLPALIFMHGGPIRQMLLGYHYYGEYYAFTYAMNQFLVNQGYVVLSVNYRSGIGYGRGFRLAENQGPRGASEYQDIVAAGRFLQSLDSVDAARIGLWGGSYGGYLTAMGLARNSDMFAAGVDFHGVHDWAWRGRDFGNKGWWAITEDLYPLAYSSSPVSDLSGWKSPALFIHGDDDRNVMFGQTVDLVQRLRGLGVTTEVLVFPNEVHSFLRHESWLDAFNATADFFDNYLGKPATSTYQGQGTHESH